jgi:hypothetical protein
MPKYFFDIVQVDGTVTRDIVGTELADEDAAREEAKRCLADMALEAIEDEISDIRIVVRNAAGERIALRTASFREE